MRYDRARTLLVLGQLQRRRNQRRAARSSLEEAAELFDAVGANRWAANARAELDRLALKPASNDNLTPTENHVAQLAASGYTVREMAATLLVSPKTVEAHLTCIYRKLGIPPAASSAASWPNENNRTRRRHRPHARSKTWQSLTSMRSPVSRTH